MQLLRRNRKVYHGSLVDPQVMGMSVLALSASERRGQRAMFALRPAGDLAAFLGLGSTWRFMGSLSGVISRVTILITLYGLYRVLITLGITTLQPPSRVSGGRGALCARAFSRENDPPCVVCSSSLLNPKP